MSFRNYCIHLICLHPTFGYLEKSMDQGVEDIRLGYKNLFEEDLKDYIENILFLMFRELDDIKGGKINFKK